MVLKVRFHDSLNEDTTILVSLEMVIGPYILWYNSFFFQKNSFKFPDIFTAHKISVLYVSHFKIKINIDFPTKYAFCNG